MFRIDGRTVRYAGVGDRAGLPPRTAAAGARRRVGSVVPAPPADLSRRRPACPRPRALRSVPLRPMPPPDEAPDPRITLLPAAEIRRRFVEFFAERGHTVVPSASLVPAGDQTLLFTNSGMVQFKDVLTGAEKRSLHPRGRLPALPARRRQAQRLRGGRPDAAPPHALRDARQLELRRLLQARGDPVGVGLPDAGPRDPGRPPRRDDLHRRRRRLRRSGATRSACPPERMARWGDVDARRRQELLADGRHRAVRSVQRDPLRSRRAPVARARSASRTTREHCPRWLEIWNLVFMEFDQRPDGRVAAAVHRASTPAWASSGSRASSSRSRRNYDTDLFAPIHARMRELLGHDPEAFEAERFSYQVIADHSRAVTFLVADGVLPSNEGRGYVLRRILRRAVRHGRLLGRREPFLAETAEVVIDDDGRAPTRTSRERRDGDPRRRSRARSASSPDARGRHAAARGGPRSALDVERARRRPAGRGPAGRRARCSPATSRSGSTTRTASRST